MKIRFYEINNLVLSSKNNIFFIYSPSTSVKLTEFNVESDGRDANFCASFVSSPLGLRASAIKSLSLTSAKDSVSDFVQSSMSGCFSLKIQQNEH